MIFAITGASGHIGNNICKELLTRGYKVRALLFGDSDEIDEMKKPGVEIVKGDVLDKQSLTELCKGADYVFHLAAMISIDKRDKDLVFQTNVKGTQNIIEVCKEENVKRLVYFSSIHVFDPFPLNEVLNEDRAQLSNPKMVYDKSKIEAENCVLKAIQEGFNSVIINPTAVFGPNDFMPSLLGQALIRIAKNQLPMLIKGGYDWVDVRDVAAGAIEACLNGRKGEKYILSGQWMSLRDLSAIIAVVTKRKIPRLTAGFCLARIGIPFIQVYAKIRNEHPLYTKDMIKILKTSHQNISSKKAQKDFGYKSRPIEDSVRDTILSYQQYGML